MIHEGRAGVVTRLLARLRRAPRTQESRKIFVYDEMMSVDTLKVIGIKPTRTMVGYVEGFVLEVSAPLVERAIDAVTLVARSERCLTFGVLHEVQASELEALEDEASNRQYIGLTIEVTDRQGFTHEARTFVARHHADGALCNTEFRDRLVAIAQDVCLPEAYAAKLATLPAR